MTHAHARICLVIYDYRQPEDRLQLRLAAHRAFLERGYESSHFLASGQRVDRAGGVIIVHGLEPAAVEALMRRDPFVKEGLAEFRIVPFNASRVCDALIGLKF